MSPLSHPHWKAGIPPRSPPGLLLRPSPTRLPSSLLPCPVLRPWTAVEEWPWLCCLPNALQQRVLSTPGAVTAYAAAKLTSSLFPDALHFPRVVPPLGMTSPCVPHSHILPRFGTFAPCFYALPDANLFSFRIVSSSALYPLPSAKLRAFHVAGVRLMYIEIELNQYLQEHFDKFN